jgi:YHS domain-containing protein
MSFVKSIVLSSLMIAGSFGLTARAGAEPAKAAKADHPPSAFDKMPAVGTKAYCPVSKETFTVTAKTQSSTVNGKTVVFCCAECKPEFDKNPSKYLTSK